MASAPLARRLVQVLCAALAIALLVVSPAAAAHPSHPRREPDRRAGRIADARAVASARCVVAGRPRRAIARRKRCNRPAARSSVDPQPIYWGATIGSQLTGSEAPWDMNAVGKFEQESGKGASVIQFFQPFANCSPSCDFYSFPTTPMNDIREHGAIPSLSWSSQAIPASVEEPDYQLSDLIEGRYDSYIRSFANEAAAWGHPFFLRFDWEMNGNWFPWSEGANGNGPGQYVAAWRHVHDIFAAAGATNVSWVWCPFVDPGNAFGDVGSFYPGDEYVDWTGLDGYNWGTNPTSPRGWKSFEQLFGGTYDRIVGSIAPTKPMMIGEMSSSEQGGSKAAWVREALNSIPTEFPSIRAVLWFDKFDNGMDWPLETSDSATSAFAETIQQPSYVGNSYAGLSGGPIQPPS